jgi:hypothetical protein
MRLSVTEQLARHVDATAGPDACWPWTGPLSRWGYGRAFIYDGDRRVETPASRAAFIAANGPLAWDVFVLHGCHNPPCCNPAHLRAGSHDENMADRKAAGNYARGWTVELPPELIDQIRAAYKPRKHGCGTPALAARFGISRSVIQRIVTYPVEVAS